MRLIDADKLKQHYAWWNNEEQRTFDQIVDAQPTVGGECIPREWLKNTNTGMNVIEMMQVIKDAPVIAFPTIDAVPVVHGWWIQNDNGTWSCNRCHSWIPDEQHYYARYCLYCGAKMDGGDNDA